MSLRPSSRYQSTRDERTKESGPSYLDSKGPKYKSERKWSQFFRGNRRRCQRRSFWLVICSVIFLSFTLGSPNSKWFVSSPFVRSSHLQEGGNVHVLTTEFGWDHPNEELGVTFGRSIWSAELWEGIQAHLRKDGWRSLSWKSALDDHRYYVFLDVETCFESQYPKHILSIGANSDRRNGRPIISSSGGLIKKLKSVCSVIDCVLETQLFQQSSNNNARLVLFDCSPVGPKSCLSRNDNAHLDHRISVVSLSASKDQILPTLDVGLPPPPVTKVSLTSSESNILENCVDEDKSRPYLLTFIGTFRGSLRSELKELDNGKDVLGGDENMSSISSSAARSSAMPVTLAHSRQLEAIL